MRLVPAAAGRRGSLAPAGGAHRRGTHRRRLPMAHRRRFFCMPAWLQRSGQLFAALLVLVALLWPARASEVRLRNGFKLEGETAFFKAMSLGPAGLKEASKGDPII